jgi:protein O-GlcNAc transferase
MSPPAPVRGKRTPPVIEVLTRAIARHQGVGSAEARRLGLAVLASEAEKFDALHYFGVLEAQRGGFDEADCLIGEALALNPRSAEACLNHGNVLSALDRHDEALASIERALAIRADYVEALNSRGAVLLDLGRPEEALATLDRAEAARPGYPEAINNRGNALRALKRPAEALDDYERALRSNPDFADALSNRGNALLDLNRPADALESYDRALAVDPGHGDALLGRGTALRGLGRYGDALESYDRALAARPDLAEARCNRGLALQELARFEEAAGDFQRLVEVRPDYDYARGHLLHARQHCCDWRNFEPAVARLADLVRNGKRAALPFEFLAVSGSPEDQQQCARIYAADCCPSASRPVWKGERYAHDKIRVAYLSADFHAHATAFLMAGLFEAHDRSRFETTAISFGPDRDDEMRGRVRRAFDRFIDVRRQGSHETAVLLRELEIDIAVDLKGHTAHGRLDILSHRPAPVQVSYLGYPGTLGLDYVDYLIADRVVVPEESLSCYDEKVVYLPDSYQANDAKRPVAEHAPTRAEAGLPEHGFVYCCFNNNYKITPATFDAWMRILQGTGDSVLWLLEDNPAAARNLRREAERRDVAPQRLVFAPRVKPEGHLARHRLADLFLDTLPYNAHTTASDALWTGVPVLTCLGTTFAGRVAASLLEAAGLPELVAPTLREYEALAVKLAHDRGALQELAGRLARNRATCALFDTDRTRRHIETAYVAMWERRRNGEPPAGFAVGEISR